MAKLGIALASGARDRRFESCYTDHSRAYSSIGRAPALQAGGLEFKSPWVHHFNARLTQLVECLSYMEDVVGSNPPGSTIRHLNAKSRAP